MPRVLLTAFEIGLLPSAVAYLCQRSKRNPGEGAMVLLCVVDVGPMEGNLNRLYGFSPSKR